MHLFAATFFLGIFAVLAQVFFTREMLVVFFGNELTIGTVLASWLVGITAGAFLARVVIPCIRTGRGLRNLLVLVLIFAAALFPAQVCLMRAARLFLGVPAGEYAPFWTIVASACGLLLPSSMTIGLYFPLACEMVARRTTDGAQVIVSRIYTWESAGSMLGGAILTFVMLPALSPARIILVATALPIMAAMMLSGGKWLKCVLLALVILLADMSFFHTRPAELLEESLVRLRWRGFGIIQEQKQSSPAVRLVSSADSIYQNLAVTESSGQFALYGNGQVMTVFPDTNTFEFSVHFMMAQNPSAETVLLMGGNPVGDIPELLKYPIKKIVCVEIDPMVGKVIRSVAGSSFDKVMNDSRIEQVAQDGVQFVRQCGEKFDIIILNTPEPATAGANRFYTREFYSDVARILEPGGFVFTAISSAERLQSESVQLGGSVYRTISSVFPVVLVTAGDRNRFFAAKDKTMLTFDRQALVERSRGASIPAQYYRPEYMLGMDEIDPDKTAYVTNRFLSAGVPLNTNLKPVTYYYNLMLWSRYSGSGLERLLGKVSKWSSRAVTVPTVVAGLLLLIFAFFRRGMSSAGNTVAGMWSKSMLAMLIALTGFCGMSLEIILIFLFQGIYGYIYSRIGMIVAAFMLGLVVGAPSGRWMASGAVGRRSWLFLGGLEILMLIIPALVILLLVWLGSTAFGGGGIAGEVMIYLAVVLTGWVVGAQFPLVNKLICDAGGMTGTAAAVTDAFDHAGSAAGAIMTGVFMVPVFGIGETCLILSVLSLTGLMLVFSAMIAMPADCRNK